MLHNLNLGENFHAWNSWEVISAAISILCFFWTEISYWEKVTRKIKQIRVSDREKASTVNIDADNAGMLHCLVRDTCTVSRHFKTLTQDINSRHWLKMLTQDTDISKIETGFSQDTVLLVLLQLSKWSFKATNKFTIWHQLKICYWDTF